MTRASSSTSCGRAKATRRPPTALISPSFIAFTLPRDRLAEFVKLAGRFSAEISVEKDGMTVNGKSIMGVLMLAAEHGSELRIRGEGEDAQEAVEALASLVNRGFEEGS